MSGSLLGKKIAKTRMQLSITSRRGGGTWDTFHSFSGIAMVPSPLMMRVLALLPTLLQVPAVSSKFSPLTLTFRLCSPGR